MYYDRFTKKSDWASDLAIGSLPWHLANTRVGGPDLNVLPVWADHDGEGVRVGIFDNGARTSNDALTRSFASDERVGTATEGRHATAVAGIVGADGRNGAWGVAPGVDGAFVQVRGTTMAGINAAMARQADFDVVNHSWGWSRDLYVDRSDALFSAFFRGIDDAARTGRDGLGTVMVAAAGNDGARGADANLSNFASDRQVIAVAAVTDAGTVASYSNSGGSLLVSGLAGGGSRGITTTDIPGSGGYAAGATTDRFSGTSAAAPTVTGVVALMLDANENLGWRDVQDILALTARSVRDTTFVENAVTTWNGGGLAFSNEAGFGLVDARAAVRLAETWTAQSTSANEVVASGSAVPDVSRLATAVTTTVEVLVAGADLLAETVELTLAGVHGRLGDLLIELVSPSGTVATAFESPRITAAFDGWTFALNAFRGEAAAGIWSVRVTDERAGFDGHLTGVEIDVFGRLRDEDDVYVYTDRFSELGQRERGHIADHAGHDAVNASAVSSASIIDLAPGAVSRIAGRDVVTANGTLIEDAFGGDGDDVLYGNELDNDLSGGRGDDRLDGRGGNDTLRPGEGSAWIDGGAGFDTVVLDGARSDWTIVRLNDESAVAQNAGGDRVEMGGVERIAFADAEILMPTTQAQRGIAQLYDVILGRAADASGLAAWSAALEAGSLAMGDVAEALLSSAEFSERSLPADSVLVDLYRAALGREAAPAEIETWLDAMDGGGLSLAGIAAHVVSAPEAVVFGSQVEFWI